MKNAYKTLFEQAFEVSLLCDELIDFIPDDIAFNFIKEKFQEEYTPKQVLKLEEEYSYCILDSMSEDDKIVTLMDLFDLEWSESETIVQEFKKEQMSKRKKIQQIIINDSCGWCSTQELLEKVTDNIYKQLKDVPNNYDKLVSAYIRLS